MKKSKSKAEPGWREKLLNSTAGQEYLAETERGEPFQKWQREAIAAKTVLEHRQAITDSITALRLMAEYRGDKEAVMALVECGVQAAHLLHTLHQGHDAESKPASDSPSVIAVNEVAASAEHWPVAVSAFQEKREPHLEETLPPGIGSRLPFRAASLGGRGSPRKMGNDTSTDFALWVFEGIEFFRNRHSTNQPLSSSWVTRGMISMGPPRFFGEDIWGEAADELESFSKGSLSAWVSVAMKRLECECAGHWTEYPFPEAIKSDAATIARDSVVNRRVFKTRKGTVISDKTRNSSMKRAVKSALLKRAKSLVKPTI